MITTLRDGRLPDINDAVEACPHGKAALLLTIYFVPTKDVLGNTRVRVRCQALNLDAVARTDTDGKVTIVIDELGDQQVELGAIVVTDAAGEEDHYELEGPSLSKQEWRSRGAYFGPIDRIELRYGGEEIDDVRFAGAFELIEGNQAVDVDGPLPKDHRYRLVVEDPHTLISTENDGLLGAEGDVISKPADYTRNDWIGSISAGVPLYAHVMRRRNGQDVKINDGDGLSVRWRILDPPPDFAAENRPMAPQRAIEWLDAVYTSLKPPGQQQPWEQAWEGNTNCPRAMGGARENNGRVKASSVLRDAATKDALQDTDDDDHAVEVPVVETEGNAGVSRVYFCPPPIGGDSYGFELVLRYGGSGVFVERGPGDMREITDTGQITLWHRVVFKLCGGVPGVALDTFRWDAIRNAYAAAYIEIDTSTTIEEELSEYGTQEAIESVYPRRSNTGYGYNEEHLLPGYVLVDYPNTIDNHIGDVTCELTTMVAGYRYLDDPNDQHADSNGLHLLLSQNVYEGSDIAGLYVGRGQFFMVQLHDYHETLAHELGHALYLRHALTGHVSRRKALQGWGAPATTQCSVVPQDNWYDHDPQDSVGCLMSYNNAFFDNEITNPVPWHFCGGCLLKLRFWDTVALADVPTYKQLVDNTLVPAQSQIVLVLDHYEDQCSTHECAQCLVLQSQQQIQGYATQVLNLRALVRPDRTQTQWSRDCWIDVADHPDAVWTSADNEVVAIQNKVITLARPEPYPGPVRLDFTLNGVSSHVMVDVAAEAPPFLEQIHARQIRATPVGLAGGRQPIAGTSVPIKLWVEDEIKDYYLAFNGAWFFVAEEADFSDAGRTDTLQIASPPEQDSGLADLQSEYDDNYLQVSVVENTQFETRYNHTYGDSATAITFRYLGADDTVWELRFQ